QRAPRQSLRSRAATPDAQTARPARHPCINPGPGSPPWKEFQCSNSCKVYNRWGTVRHSDFISQHETTHSAPDGGATGIADRQTSRENPATSAAGNDAAQGTFSQTTRAAFSVYRLEPSAHAPDRAASVCPRRPSACPCDSDAFAPL